MGKRGREGRYVREVRKRGREERWVREVREKGGNRGRGEMHGPRKRGGEVKKGSLSSNLGSRRWDSLNRLSSSVK